MRAHEIFEGPIIGCLAGLGKEAGRQLFHAAMITDALATNALALAPGIGAVAILHVPFFVLAVLQVFFSLQALGLVSWFCKVL
jgi:hypothetical protein